MTPYNDEIISGFLLVLDTTSNPRESLEGKINKSEENIKDFFIKQDTFQFVASSEKNQNKNSSFSSSQHIELLKTT